LNGLKFALANFKNPNHQVGLSNETILKKMEKETPNAVEMAAEASEERKAKETPAP